MKKTLHIILLGALLAGAPLATYAEELFEGPESEITPITLSMEGTNVRICGANGQTLNVYNLAGVKVGSHKIDSNDKTIDLNLTKGCYILKVGNIARKISVR